MSEIEPANYALPLHTFEEFWKFKLPEPGGTVTYSIPMGWTQTLVDRGYMWVRVAPGHAHEDVEITTVGTGRSFPPTVITLGTWTDPPFVWHAVARVLR